MAKIEDLIAQIPDERLRKALREEVRELKKTKKFGLVFEEHLPETVRLPNLPVKVGELVAKKQDTGNELWRVKSIKKKTATLEKPLEGYRTPADEDIEAAVDQLVVVRSFGDPIYPALTPVDKVARGGPDKPWHVLINSDNFHALQLLLYAYEGKVDVIYIDPPYNTGARDWKYNNDYVDRNDPWRHSKWLSFMHRRLTLARRLLKEDGFVVVTIDEHEVQHLGCLLEQILPNYRRQLITIVNNAAGVSQGGFFRVEEYAYVCFAGKAKPVPSDDDYLSDEEDPQEVPIWFSLIRYGGINALPSKRKGLVYPIAIDPKTNRIVGYGRTLKERCEAGEVRGNVDEWQPPKDEKVKGCPVVWPFRGNGAVATWQVFPDTLMKLLGEGFVRVRPQKDGVGGNKWSISYVKSGNQAKVRSGEIETLGREPSGGAYILKQTQRRVMPKSVWRRARHDAGKWGSRTIRELLGDVSFDYAKSPYAVRDMLKSLVADRKHALVLDFFGGSGTTLHATALLNAEDKGCRQCILVTNNEVDEPTAAALSKQDIGLGDAEYEAKGICDAVTWPRCKAAVEGVKPNGTRIEGYYQIKDSEGNFLAIGNGLDENLQYLRLEFLDADAVARGDAFQAILPILWMMAGCRGELHESKGSTPWLLPKQAPFAVLIREKEFPAFRQKLAERDDIEWVFLVTDSDDNFAAMRRALGRKYECRQLYKSYLDNFRINTRSTTNA